MLSSSVDVAARWKEYSCELYQYKVEVDQSILYEVIGEGETDSAILKSVVVDAMAKLKINKAPGYDFIFAELIKSGGDSVVDMLW